MDIHLCAPRLSDEELERFGTDPTEAGAPCAICGEEGGHSRDHYSTHPTLQQYLNSFDRDSETFVSLFALFGSFQIVKSEDVPICPNCCETFMERDLKRSEKGLPLICPNCDSKSFGRCLWRR